jgi:hypothetical protein
MNQIADCCPAIFLSGHRSRKRTGLADVVK